MDGRRPDPLLPTAVRPVARRGEGAPPLPVPPVTTRRSSIGAVLVRLLVVLLLVACGLLTLLIVFTDTGPTGLVVGAVLAMLPVFPVVAAYLWLDRYEAEPARLLAFAFAWGAFVATFISVVLNTSSTQLIRAAGGAPGAEAVLVAPVVEESTKGLAVLLLFWFRRREFDGVVDGIVYAGMAGIGFAFVENILYLGRSFADDGGSSTAATFVVRCIFSPFAHPLFTAATGIGIGVAAATRSRLLKVVAPVVGFVVAVLLHGAWNLSASTGIQGFFGSYLFLQLPIFVLAAALALTARAREGRLLRRHLGAYADAGWVTRAEADMLGSLSERDRALDWAGRTLGPGARRAMRDFQEIATELAFQRERMVRGTAGPDAPASEVAMLQAMWHLRQEFLPRAVGPR